MFHKLWFKTLVVLSTTIAFATAIGPQSTLFVSNMNVSPDGFTRAASVVNGVHPGPLITAQKGEQFRLNVVNQLTDRAQLLGTSIHWHGLFQKNTNFMDGAVGVNQCPIAPNHSFQYAFDGKDQAGTYWYHSHFGVQYCDGVRGPMVIYDPSDPHRSLYDVDDESTVITISEWYHQLATNIFGIALADSTLINGKGRYVGGPNAELAVVGVERGKRYRFRLISLSCDPNFTFSIDNHDLTIIEVEGTSVQPLTVNTIQILAGQRYSFVLNANQPTNNYWIRALPNTGRRLLPLGFTNGVNSAILRYRGAPGSNPTSSQQFIQNKLAETDLRPLTRSTDLGRPVADGADVTFDLRFGFRLLGLRFTINGASFEPPTVPVLLQLMSGARTAQELLPKGSVLTVKRNQVVQVNLPAGLIGGPHPFHMHGHAFSVVRSADTYRYNFDNPIVRDVVRVGRFPGDFVAIRFRTDNPGPWILHCHIDFHLDQGLAIVFAEDPEDTVAENPNPPADWNQLCPDWNGQSGAVKDTRVSGVSPA